jgi:hypothetical protein
VTFSAKNDVFYLHHSLAQDEIPHLLSSADTFSRTVEQSEYFVIPIHFGANILHSLEARKKLDDRSGSW